MRKNDGKQYHFNTGAHADQEMRWQKNDYFARRLSNDPAPRGPKTRRNTRNGLGQSLLLANLLDSGHYKSIDDLARKRKINASYMSRILRLNQLAPQIKKAILDGTQPRQLSLQDMQTPFPDVWDEQLKHFGFA